MSKKKMKKIDINSDIWTRLHDLRGELKYKKWSATIGWLLDHQSSQGENTQKPDHEKLLQDFIGEETLNQIHELMSSHNLDISGITRHLIDCHRLLEREKPLKKLEEKTVLNEIYTHIEKLKPLRKIEEEPVPSELSVVDMAQGKSQNHIDDTTKKQEWLCCPLCRSLFPLLVELDQDGNPLKKHEDGVKFKDVDGVLQRRFIGPDDSYLPIQTRIGGEIIVEESMAISTLRCLDKALFDDFTDVLKAVTFKFVGGWW